MTRPATLVLPGRHDQVARARSFVRRVAERCPVLDEAVLLTSELCTNALQHTDSGTGGSFEITVYLGSASLRIEVHDDGSKSTPAVRRWDDMAEDGRGLEIVAVVADCWGQCGNEYGRSVYFELRWNPQDRPGRPDPRQPGAEPALAAHQAPPDHGRPTGPGRQENGAIHGD